MFIQLPAEQDSKTLVQQKARFLSKLDILLGEQKIDVLINTAGNHESSIVKTAKSTGIIL